MLIRRLLWTLLIGVGAMFVMAKCAMAQAPAGWTISDLKLSAFSLAPGGAETVTVTFTSPADAAGATLSVAIYDPTGAHVTNGQTWQTGVNLTAGQPLPAAPLVWTVPAGQPPGIYTVAVGAFLADGSNPFYLTEVANFTLMAAPGPPCMPNLVQWPPAVVHGQLPDGVSTRYSYHGGWLCRGPTGYRAIDYLLSPTADIEDAVLRFLAGFLSPADAAAMIAAGTDSVPLTATEKAFGDAQVAALLPVVKVAFVDQLTPTRQVYGANADGTLNPAAVPGELVSVADPCDPRFQLAGTPYFSVAGRPNVNGGTLPAGSYALCVITAYPHGVN